MGSGKIINQRPENPHLCAFAVIALLVFSLMIGSSLVIAEEPSFLPPQLLSKTEVLHPDMNYNEREENASYDSGVVELIYMVDEQGNSAEISVLRSSLKKFEAAAIESIQAYSYRPAMLGDKPVSSVITSTVVFKLNRRSIAFDRWYLRGEGVKQDDEFSRLFKKLKKELTKTPPDLETLDKLFVLMSNLKSRSFDRLVNTSFAKLKLAEKFDLEDQRIVALQELLWLGEVEYEGKKNDPDALSSIRKSLLKLLIDGGRYSESLSLYAEASDSDQSIRKAFGDYISQIETLKNDDSIVGRMIVILNSGKIGVPLLKRAFTLDKVSGRLDSIKLRCETNFVNLTFKIGAEYRLPADWGACNMEIIGATSTTAMLYEF